MLKGWDEQTVPDENFFKALYKDLSSAHKFLAGKSSTRLNYEKPGWKSLIKKSVRNIKKIENPPFKEAMIEIDKRWGDVSLLAISHCHERSLIRADIFLMLSIENLTSRKNIVMQPQERQVYVMLWWRTLLLEFHRHNRMPPFGLSNGTSFGNLAAQVFKFINDLCLDAILDIFIGPNCSLDGNAPTGGRDQ